MKIDMACYECEFSNKDGACPKKYRKEEILDRFMYDLSDKEYKQEKHGYFLIPCFEGEAWLIKHYPKLYSKFIAEQI